MAGASTERGGVKSRSSADVYTLAGAVAFFGHGVGFLAGRLVSRRLQRSRRWSSTLSATIISTSESLVKATPILLCALAVILPARLGLITVGGEGQFISARSSVRR